MTNSIVLHEYNGVAIPQRKDGYVSLTAMAKAEKKAVGHYLALSGTKVYLEALSRDIGIAMSELIHITKGNYASKEEQGTWAHPKIGDHFSAWCKSSPSRQKGKAYEISISNALAKQLCGKREVQTIAGVIDVVTCNEIIEVKDVKRWKQAIGQVLVYGLEFPCHRKRIHLFGDCSESLKAMILDKSLKLGVLATFEM